MKLRSSNTQFEIYEETVKVLSYVILMAITCIGFGGVFAYLGAEYTFSIVFGIVFMMAGVWMLLQLPNYLARMQQDSGSVSLKATKNGVSIAPVLNMKPVDYHWSDISRMSLAKKLVIKDDDGTCYSWHQLVVYFRRERIKPSANLIQRSKQRIMLSPTGDSMTIVAFPRGEMVRVKAELTRLMADDIGINAYNRLMFDYKATVEKGVCTDVTQ